MTVKLSVDCSENYAYNIIVYCYYHYHIIQESGAAIDSKAFLGILLKLT